MRKQTHKLPGLVITNHEYLVPLDHLKPNADKIKVFAREIVAAELQTNRDLPWLVFFQGGPGFPSPRPDTKSGWLKRAVKDYRVLLLDQRGTGLSTPVTFQTLARFPTAKEQVEYLKNFRADSIVLDAELIRKELLGPGSQWTGLGQSYGGFCLTHYLCAAPEGLKEAIITGGLPPVEAPIDDIYRATYRRVIDKNSGYYMRYPEDLDKAREIVDYLFAHEVALPGGGRLTPRRFQQLGISFGFSDGFEHVHYLLENAFVDGASGRELSYTFLRGFENALQFETNPIYAILHEAVYCQEEASRWSAARVLAEYPDFEVSAGKPVLFTGEMIYPWMFDEYKYLQALKEAAEMLAAYDGWPRLYDAGKLQSSAVPSSAAVFYQDMYVETSFSEATGKLVPSMKLWITNEYEHNAIRADGEKVLDRLISMLRGEV